MKKLKYFGDRIIKIDNEKNKRAKKGFQIKFLVFSAAKNGIIRDVDVMTLKRNLVKVRYSFCNLYPVGKLLQLGFRKTVNCKLNLNA